MNTFVIAVASIVLSVAAQFSLKMGMGGAEIKAVLAQPFTAQTVQVVLCNFYIVVGFLLYGLGAIVWLAVLAQWDVSKAYPLVGLGFLFTVAIGTLAGEEMSLLRIAGVSMIGAGVWMVASS